VSAAATLGAVAAAGGDADGVVPGILEPAAPGPFGPTNLWTRSGDGGPDDLTPADLADVGACAECHADAVAQWRQSAHAQASFGNPFYRASVEDFAARQPPDRARFCGGCHDPVLVLAGALDGGPTAVQPEDPLAQVGVTCLVCHGARAPGPDGNASFGIDLSPVPLPTPGDASSLAAHVARLEPDGVARGALCGSCHRSHLGPAVGVPTHLPGIDDLGAWSRSPWSGSTGEDPTLDHPRQSCGSCHQPAVPAPLGDRAAAAGLIRSHRFAGAQTELAAGDAAQAEAVATMLGSAVRVVVAGARIEGTDGGPGAGGTGTFRDPRRVVPAAGADLVVDVVVENVGAGHAFPGGTRDLQGTTVVLDVADADGRRLASSEGDPHRLRATLVDEDGHPERLHRVDRFRAGAADTTVPAAASRAVRHRLAVPIGVALPLRLTARVVHRRHEDAFRAFVCAAERTPRGKRFRRAAAARPLGPGGGPASACGEAPALVVAEETVWTGGPPHGEPGGRAPEREALATRGSAASGGGASSFARALLHGRALAAGLADDHLDAARARLRDALRLLSSAPREGADPENAALLRAHVFLQLGRVDGRLGRTGEALRWLARSEDALGAPHPAIDRLRGDALLRVWRFPEALAAYRRVVSAVPRDPSLWRALARAAGSAGDDPAALAAARRGLQGLPRDRDLLRTRALSLSALGLPGAEHARRRWLDHRLSDHRDTLAWRCADQDAGCRRARAPIPELRLTPR